MGVIIPYHADLAVGGAFIKPDGEFLHLKDNKHDEFAEEYCNGHDFKIYTGATFGPPQPILTTLAAQNQFQEDNNVFLSTSLTKDQLNKYKFWLAHHDPEERGLCTDFLVFMLAFDKVERLVHDLITTTAAEPHVRFYNYYLMDWNISVQPKMIYDYHQDKYVPIDNYFTSISNYADREAEDEIEEIKAKVLLKDRHYFFK